LKIIVFPASNGDSFLIETEISAILIDGGYVNTFLKHIKNNLLRLKKMGMKLTLVVVTHIDNDHISGIIKLIEENKFNELVEIENVWHNSFQQLKDIGDSLTFNGKQISDMNIKYQLAEETDSKKKNISSVQGSTLASLLKKYNHNWNTSFRNNFISTDSENEININDVNFKILSPNNNKLKELTKHWKRELYKRGFSSDVNLTDFNEDAFEYILSLEKEKRRLAKKNVSSASIVSIKNLLKEQFMEDDTATNGSAIAFIIEHHNFKLLFLADAHPSVIIQNLKVHYSKEEYPIKFDLIKISHHGSKNNTSSELLKYIDSEKYVFSTNGFIHNHPDKETIARIISREVKFTRNLYFNYPLDKINDFKNDNLMDIYNYKIVESSPDKPLEFNF